MAIVFFNKMFFVAVLVVSLWAFQGWPRSLHEASMEERHAMWMARFNKVYKDDADKEKHFEIFKANVEYIESSNKAGNKPYKLGFNQFTDLTSDEFREIYNGYKMPTSSSSSTAKSFRYENATVVPTSLDWRTKGVVTPVKDQGQCGKSNLFYAQVHSIVVY